LVQWYVDAPEGPDLKMLKFIKIHDGTGRYSDKNG